MARISIAQRIRCNHALEHATVHILSSTGEPLALVGRSDWGGFDLYGEVATEAVHPAVEQALQSLRGGLSELAIHPRCGTNIAATAVLGAGAIWGAKLIPDRSRTRRFARMLAAGLIALTLGQSFGLALQRHVTTDASVGDLSIDDIRRTKRGAMTVHRIRTRQTG